MTEERSTRIVKFMTPGAGALVQGRGNISYVVKMHYFFKNLRLYSQAYNRQTKCKVMMTKEGFIKIVNFMTPGAGVLVQGRRHISHIVKMHCFFKNLLLFSQPNNRQTKCIVMITKKGCAKIVNSRSSCAGAWPYKLHSKNKLLI